jgi:hypothetical protein
MRKGRARGDNPDFTGLRIRWLEESAHAAIFGRRSFCDATPACFAPEIGQGVAADLGALIP